MRAEIPLLGDQQDGPLEQVLFTGESKQADFEGGHEIKWMELDTWQSGDPFELTVASQGLLPKRLSFYALWSETWVLIFKGSFRCAWLPLPPQFFLTGSHIAQAYCVALNS